MTDTEPQRPYLNRVIVGGLILGLIGLMACAAGWHYEPAQFFQSYLFAYMYWLGIPLGAVAALMVLHLVGGAWGLVIRRPLEAAAFTLPLMALLLVPILFFGLPDLYSWARPEAAGEPAIAPKAAYLNFSAVLVRAILYFAIWSALGYLLNRWSLEQDRTDDRTGTIYRAPTRRLRTLGGPGLVLYVLTVTFAAIDWVMSLQPGWYSTIYGMIFVAGQGLVSLAFATVVVALLSSRPPLAGTISANNFHDLGNLLLTFVILWAYLGFSQLLIIWAGNLPEEIQFYIPRFQGGWEWVGVFLVAFQFALPFFVLLSRAAKRRAWAIGLLAALIMAVHLVDLFWLVAPTFRPIFTIDWLDLATPIGIGGIWLAAFAWRLKGHPLMPLHDPRAREASEHEGHEAPGRP